jgi:hypothetical protein
VHQSYSVNVSTWNSTITPNADEYSHDLSAITLLNDAPTVYFRLTVVDGVSVNGGAISSTGSSRVDNFTITTAPPAGTPTITVNPSLPAFTAFAGTPSASQSFLVTGADLTTAIDLVADPGFEVSSDDVTFGSNASLPSTGGTGYARVSASASIGPVSGNITLSSTGATNKTVGLTGTVGNPDVLTLTLNPTSIPEDSGSPAVGTISIPVARPANLEVTLVSANTAAATVPATATITAGQLSTTFNATPVPAPSSFATESSLITASAAGLIEGTATLQVTNVDVPPVTSISLTASPYTQDFNSLGTVAFPNAVSSTIGAQSSLGAFAGNPLDGWYVTKIAGNGSAATSISPDTGTGGSGLVNNYGATASADRALGLLASGSNTMAMGALITNNTGTALTGLTLSMTAEFWRSSTATQNTLTFGYGKVAGGITTANFLSVEDAGVLPLTGLDVVGPPFVTSNGPLDGNNATNQSAFTNISLPLALAPGESAFVRWQDVNDSGNDAGLAIDNLTIAGSTTVVGGGFATWIDGFFEGETNEQIIGFNADPDNDGVSNGVEALIGGNPDSPGVFAATELTKNGNTFTFLYPQAKSIPSGITPSYEWSTDLANWQGTGGSFGGVTVTLADGLWNDTAPLVDIYQVTATVTDGSATTLFVRVVANNN